MAQYSKRGRNSNRRRQGGNNNPNRSMDSQGPEVKIRGTAAQIYEKYQALARDASSSGDRIRGESLMQHAEHYYRLMKSMQPAEKKDEKKDDQNAEAQQGDQQKEAQTSSDDQAKAESSDENTSNEQGNDSGDEESRPRRRRRRRKTSDEGDAAEASGNDGDKTEAKAEETKPAAELEGAAAE